VTSVVISENSLLQFLIACFGCQCWPSSSQWPNNVWGFWNCSLQYIPACYVT